MDFMTRKYSILIAKIYVVQVVVCIVPVHLTKKLTHGTILSQVYMGNKVNTIKLFSRPNILSSNHWPIAVIMLARKILAICVLEPRYEFSDKLNLLF